MVTEGTEVNLAQRLIEEVRKKHKCVVVIGDAMTDVWVHGRLEECQDGCPKLIEEIYWTAPGGAANAEQCLINWGVGTLLFGRIENDRPIKYRLVGADGKIVCRWDNELVLQSEDGYEWVRNSALAMVKFASAVLLSDYDKGFLTPEFIREVVGLCAERGIPCVADAKREPYMYSGAILKCNEVYAKKYYREVFNRDIRRVVTYGCHRPSTGKVLVLDLPLVKCINHVGAGDCFAAHLTLALAYEFSLEEAAAIAHSAGRVYVQHHHNRPPMPEEIVADMGGVW